ncbi:STAS/SEC14 domain-containing protein [Litchfieldia alkalitelluris]|uniref:STAS/SEC14 domain-containing protein n=1 Tax=Litchfieldia alkalitelluris TaxID=304268 RepID=UPI0014727CEB|nr:STAS/SEC14 domain-containing protein [Litchfieldia alkalitelluris]
MYKLEVIDQNLRIFGLAWLGKVSPEEVQEVNDKLASYLTELNIDEFDLLVDMSEITVLLPATQKEIVKHQEWLLQNGMQRAAVVVNSSIAKLQLKRTARESNHAKEFHFDTVKQALGFLKEVQTLKI